MTATIRQLIPSKLRAFRNRISRSAGGFESFAFDEKLDVRASIEKKYNYRGELLDIFCNNKNYVVHKWHHYLPLYDRYFSPFRGSKVRFLEIGVSKGGSLQMWREYFGADAII